MTGDVDYLALVVVVIVGAILNYFTRSHGAP